MLLQKVLWDVMQWKMQYEFGEEKDHQGSGRSKGEFMKEVRLQLWGNLSGVGSYKVLEHHKFKV